MTVTMELKMIMIPKMSALNKNENYNDNSRSNDNNNNNHNCNDYYLRSIKRQELRQTVRGFIWRIIQGKP